MNDYTSPSKKDLKKDDIHISIWRIFILKEIDEWKTLTKQTIDPLPIPPWPPPSSLSSLFQRDEDGVIDTYEFQELFNIESKEAFQDLKMTMSHFYNDKARIGEKGIVD